MQESDIVLATLTQADGSVKNRPAVFLRLMPPYDDLLVCGVSTQLRLEVPQFDELISITDSDFKSSGLRTDSLIRLGFLAVLPKKSVVGAIGSISEERHLRLLSKLSAHLLNSPTK